VDRATRARRCVLFGLLATLACAPSESAERGPSESGAGGSSPAPVVPSASAGIAGAAGTAAARGGSAGALGTEPAAALGGAAGTSADAPSTAGGSSGVGGEGGGVARADCARAASGIAVYSQLDALAYAPYALAECSLAYVAPDGALRLRDLVSGSERVLEESSWAPRRPAMSRDVVAWEVAVEGKSQVRVFHGETTVTLSGTFEQAGEPRAATGFVAFTAWPASDGSDTDVFTYDLASGRIAVAIGGAGQQRFADVSEEYVAATDFSEDPGGIYDPFGSLSDLVLVERGTGTLVRRARPGKQAFPLLGSDGSLVYLEWTAVHPEPKFSAYSLQLGRVQAPPESDVLVRAIQSVPGYSRPSLRDGIIDFIDLTTLPATLYRVNVRTPDTLVPEPIEGTPFSPVTATGFTVIGTRVDTATELRVMSR
jgi:hypothetical protein